jgi:hypothetical protein
MGRKTYPEARELLITADGGGSNGSRTRLWKVALQRMANATGMKISVCHLPPGTSKWNKIEHRMFCHITRNWRGRPLESLEVVVNLIASTTTTKGLRVRAALDTDEYPTGIKIDDATMASLRLIPNTMATGTTRSLRAKRIESTSSLASTRREGCGFCSGVLHSARYPRKARGGPSPLSRSTTDRHKRRVSAARRAGKRRGPAW